MTLTAAMHCATLRDGSLWLTLPAFSHMYYDDGMRFWLSPLCFAVCCASYMHWDDHHMTGCRRMADISLSFSYLVSEFATKSTIESIDFLLRFAAFCTLCLCWEIPVGSTEGLTYHLMFRYLGWIAVMRSYTPMLGLAVLSPIYVATAYHTIRGTSDRPNTISRHFCGRTEKKYVE